MSVRLVRSFLRVSLVVSLPVSLAAQYHPALKGPHAAIQANVGRISQAPERERWQENAALWNVKVYKAKLEPMDVEVLTARLDRMQTHVSQISDGAEKERWQANCDMWKVLLSLKYPVAKPDRDRLRAKLDLMKANVMKIRVPAEKERWDANLELWTVTLRVL